MTKIRSFLFYFLLLVYVSGSIGMVLKPSFFLPFTPLSLLLTSTVFLLFQPVNTWRYALAFSGVALLGFLSEWLGVKTGMVFGEYWYGQSLGPKIQGVPVLISLNWALLVTAGLLAVGSVVSHPLITPLLSSLLITGIDYLMEQSAAQLDYWYFKEGIAGLHNYLGWFLVSFLGAILFYNPLHKGNSRIAVYILLLQVLFFGTIFLSNRLPL
jgi:bisanhydrobacterioruberin hydratase